MLRLPFAPLSSALLLAACGLLNVACAGHSSVNAGEGGSAGSAGSSGTSDQSKFQPPQPITGAPPTFGASPVKCAGSAPAEAPLVRACVLLAGCSPGIPEAPVSDCIEKALPDSGAFADCVVGAQSCAEMNACTGRGFYEDPCGPEQFGSTCVGTKLVSCPDVGPRSFVDCATTGATCAQYQENEDLRFTSAGCAVAPSCTTPSDVYTCSGTKRVRCQHGIGFGEDCAARGLACVDAPGGAICVSSPAGCTEPGTSRCDALDQGTFCQPSGQALALDCGRIGFACQVDPDRLHGIACVNPACPAADAEQCFEECDGPLAHLCLGGQRLSIDCQTYGFRGCLLDTPKGSGDRARCGDF